MSDKKPYAPLVHTDRVSLLIRNRTGNVATVPSADVIASSHYPDGQVRILIYREAEPAQMSPSEFWRIVVPSHERAFRVLSTSRTPDHTTVITAELTPIYAAEREAIHRVLAR
jgi:hypothetical protein